MNELYNIYCDESCHLERDESNVMILGAISCPNYIKKDVYEDIRRIKVKHDVNSKFEIKWTKVSQAKIEFYLEILAYFFRNTELSYRCIVATGKKQLDHVTYNDGDYDKWYYKMYFFLLNPMTPPHYQYRIFIDIKDTRGGPKVAKLQQVLCHSKWDFDNEIVKDVRQIQSHESEIMQITDLLNGAMAYYHRNINSNTGKNTIIKYLIDHYDINLAKSTSPYAPKFNIFIWKPRGTH